MQVAIKVWTVIPCVTLSFIPFIVDLDSAPTLASLEVKDACLTLVNQEMEFPSMWSMDVGNYGGGIRAVVSHVSILRNALLQHVRVASPVMRPLLFARHESASAAQMEEHGFESTTISDILKAKGKSADGSWLWCTTNDTVYDAVKSMTNHNVGALVVVKPGEQKSIAGIITERDYLRKIIVQGRSSKSTKVGDIMTEENKLITLTPDTKVLKAMQLMTDNRIRHIPVVDDSGMIGMVSIGDVVRAVVTEHRDELDRLNAYIQGGY